MAILDCLIEKKARIIATTHHGILKNYGYSRQYAENASAEFDPHTLSPTYRIITGIPGESRAIDIALRNGLPEETVSAARNYLDNGYADVSALINGLRDKHRELDTLAQRTKLEDQRIKEERRKSDLKELRLRQKEAELKEGFAGKLKSLLDESRKTLENLIRELREGEVSREKTLRVNEFLNELARTVEAEDAALKEEKRVIAEENRRIESPREEGTADFAPGMEVLAGPQKRRGKLVRIEKKGKKENGSSENIWIVETGSLKISFSEHEIVPAAGKNAHPLPLKPHIATFDLASPSDVRAE